MEQSVVRQKPFNKQQTVEIIETKLSHRRYNALNLPVICCMASLSLMVSGDLFANTVRFNQNQYTFNETQGTVNLQVDLTITDYGGPCEIDIPILDAPEQLIDASAVASPNNDFTINTTLLRISVTEQAIGANISYSGNVSLSIHRDDIIEENESFELYFGTPQLVTGECLFGGQLDISQPASILIENRFTQFSTLAINANPGQRASATFTLNTVVDGLTISSDLAESGIARVSPSTVSVADNLPVTVTYEYDIPPDAPVDTPLSDTLRITTTNQNISFSPIEIPVEINVQAKPLQNVTTQTLGNAWDSLCANGNTSVESCADLTGEELTQKQRRDLSPEELTAMGIGVINITKNHMRTIIKQQQARRNRVKAIDLTNVSAMINGQTIPVGRIIDGYLYNQLETGGSAGDLNIGTPWSFFATGSYNNGDKDATQNDDGFDFDTTGVTLGGDYRLSSHLFLGAAFGYASMNSDFANNGGDLDIGDTSITFYGIYNTDMFHVDWSMHYGQVDFEFTRKIDSFSTETQGDTNADKYALSMTLGMDYNKNAWLLTPYMRIDYIDTSIDSFQETGGKGLALDIKSQDVTSTTTALGGSFSYASSKSWGILTPTAHIEWVHEYNNDNRDIIAAFAANPGVLFSTPVDDPDQNFFVWSLGVSAVFPQGRSFFINYEGVSLQESQSNNTLYIGGRMDL
ncbi:MAG: autotransporter outer membrane beta-barrel domain-containing protein [Gammaproteobacteria bacterium]|nr:autotransporter outer membrane beta-barrel domain-containing protein [Gammaproteobacteria bacterium]